VLRQCRVFSIFLDNITRERQKRERRKNETRKNEKRKKQTRKRKKIVGGGNIHFTGMQHN
jgi:hypothetical protein